MLNLIKMDIYRMVHTKSLYVIAAIFAMLIVMSTALLKSDMEAVDNSSDKEVTQEIDDEMDSEDVNIGINVIAVTDDMTKVTLQNIVFPNVRGKIVALFIVIFAVMFALADIKSGFIKNIGGIVGGREKLVLSKAAALFLYTVGMFAFYIIVQGISDLIIFRYFKLGDAGQLFSYLAAQIMLHYAFALIAMGIAIILKSSAFSMTIVVCMTFNVMIPIYAGVENLFDKIGIKDLHIINKTVTGKIGSLPMNPANKETCMVIFTAVIFGVAATALTGFVFRKRDI